MMADNLDRKEFWFKERHLDTIIKIIGQKADNGDEKTKYIHREFSVASERFRALFGEGDNKKVVKALGRAESLPVWLSQEEAEKVFESLVDYRDSNISSIVCAECGDKGCARSANHESECVTQLSGEGGEKE